MEEYRPHEKNRIILTRAWEHVQSIPYSATSRWLFYRLLQDGYYRKPDPPRHDDYHQKFLPLLSKARKRFYEEWRPDSIVDDTREAHRDSQLPASTTEWLEALADWECVLDRWALQGRIGVVVFEADAMRRQFEWFVPYVFSLWPFGGDPSIEYKWRLAQYIKDLDQRHQKPITLFYFGDLDKKGLEIASNALTDIYIWSGVDFKAIRGGLNPGDEKRYDIPENFERPGQYQWVALTHKAAGDIIARTIEGFYEPGLTTELEQREQEATRRFREAIQSLL